MVICKIWDADYPWDVRVEKVCRSLQQKHKVHLVCRNTKRSPVFEDKDGISIHRLPFLPDFMGRLNSLISFPAFFNPLWLFIVGRTVWKSCADMILVRDLPLALTALVVGRIFGLPVVLDMAENYPAMMQDLLIRRRLNLVNVFVRNPLIVRWMEKLCIRGADHILVVIEESRDRLVKLGIPPSKITLVMNTPTLERLCDNAAITSSPFSRSLDEVILIYLGLIEWPRGLDTVVLALEQIRTNLPHVRLLVIGSGRDEKQLRSLVNEMGLNQHVQFLGWINYSEAQTYIFHADIALVPHYVTESWNTTIPNKLFDYMCMGKPVIVSNAKPVARIVTEENCGVVFKDRDAKDLADRILILSDKSLRQQLGQRGREAVMRRYNWSVDEYRLLAAMEVAINPRSD